MGQKVGHNKPDVAFVLADVDGYAFTVLAVNNAVKRKGNSCPLVFFDSAVIMSFEERELRIFIKRIGLYVKTGGIDVGSDNFCSLFKAFRAENAENESLFAVFVINLVACLVACLGVKGSEALFFGKGFGISDSFTLGFAGVEVGFVAFAEGIGGFDFAVFAGICRMIVNGKKLFLEDFCLCFFAHFYHPFRIYRLYFQSVCSNPSRCCY